MAKLSKAAVEFVHPARGRHHCAECRHFVAPEECRIVAGRVLSRDWCKRFEDKQAHREAVKMRQIGVAGSPTSEEYSRQGAGWAAGRMKG